MTDPTKPPATPPLDYHSPTIGHPFRNTILMIVGFLLGAGAVAFIGLFAADATSHGEFQFHSWPAAGAFFAVGVCFFLGFVARMRAGFRPFIAGLLLGLSLAALVEGLCFAGGS
jgi:hypothetical protein